MNNGYGICPNEWLEDERIKTQLRLLIKISSLTAENGYCYASNEYFAKYFNTTTVTISSQISKLIKLNYISAEYKKRGAQVEKRFLRLKKTLTVGYRKLYPTVKENFKDNSTSINNTSIKEKKNTKKKKINPRFQKPTLIEIQKYAEEKSYKLDPQHFIDFYDSKNWMIGKNKMSRWKSAVANWARNQSKFNGDKNGKNIKSNAQSRFEQSEYRGRQMLQGYDPNDPMF